MPVYIDPKKRRYSKSKDKSSTDYLSRTDKSNDTALNAIAELGLTEDFEKRQKPGIWDNLKSAGSNVLDVLQRGEYASAAGINAYQEGGGLPEIAKAAGTEILSGIGNIEGTKQTIPDVVKKYNPGYNEFAQEHPIASIGTDLGMSILGDPTTFIPAKAIAGGISKLGKPLGAVAKTIGKIPTGRQTTLADDLGKTFSPSYTWRKGAGEEGQKAYDIYWAEGKKADAYKRGLSKNLKPATEEIATWDADKAKDCIRVMYDGKVADAPEVQKVADTLNPVFRTMGRKESRYLGKNPNERLLENYFPNLPKSYTDLMTNAGEYQATGHGRGLADWKRTFEKEKVLKTGDEFLNFLQSTGVKDEDIPEVLIRNISGRTGQSAARIRQIRTHTKWTKELPDVFREVPVGTKTVWNDAVQPGESLWMPAGNLRFFPSESIKLNKDIREILENGGEISGAQLKELVQTMPSVTTNVKAYAVPKDIVGEINKVSTRLADTTGAVKYFDKMLNIFKNTAIMSPGFHVRNFISSGTQSYLHDVNPSSYVDGVRVLAAKNSNMEVAGKSVGGWRNMARQYGVLGGSFAGQDVGKAQTGIKGINTAFELNRNLGGHIEDIHRLSTFIDRVKKGDSFMDAAKMVKKIHFDYNELTDIEREGFRRLIPFYSWTRFNTPYIIDRVLKNPKKLRNIAKLKEAVSGGQDNENAPNWWKNNDVWQTKFKNKEGDNMAVSVGLPYAQLNLDNPTSLTGPVGAIGNLARNYDSYYEKPITEFKGQTEPFIQIGDKTIRTTPAVKYAIENLMPVVKRYGTDLSLEISQIAQSKVSQDTKLKALSKLVGVRLLPLTKDTQEKNRIYKLQKEIIDYKKYLKQEEEIKTGKQ